MQKFELMRLKVKIYVEYKEHTLPEKLRLQDSFSFDWFNMVSGLSNSQGKCSALRLQIKLCWNWVYLAIQNQIN